MSKSDQTLVLTDVVEMIENQFVLRVKVIRVDRARENMTETLNNYCKSKGIRQEFANAEEA